MFVEIPCDIGQAVFWVTTVCNDEGNEEFDIYAGEVCSFSIQKEGLWAYCRYDNGLTYWHVVKDHFGSEVFSTKQAAHEKLKELISKNKEGLCV